MLKVYGERTATLEGKGGNVEYVERPVAARSGDGDFIVANEHDIHLAVVDAAD